MDHVLLELLNFLQNRARLAAKQSNKIFSIPALIATEISIPAFLKIEQ
jgi:hypothetical protein